MIEPTYSPIPNQKAARYVWASQEVPMMYKRLMPAAAVFAALNSKAVMRGLLGALSTQMAPALVLACLNAGR
jgi:hypothetical protein